MRTSREQSRASHIERRKTKSSKSSSKSSPSPQSSSRASPSPQIPSPNLLKLLRILFLNPLEIHKILFQILSKSSKSSSKSSNPRCCKKEKVKKSRLKPETVDRLYSTTWQSASAEKDDAKNVACVEAPYSSTKKQLEIEVKRDASG